MTQKLRKHWVSFHTVEKSILVPLNYWSRVFDNALMMPKFSTFLVWRVTGSINEYKARKSFNAPWRLIAPQSLQKRLSAFFKSLNDRGVCHPGVLWRFLCRGHRLCRNGSRAALGYSLVVRFRYHCARLGEPLRSIVRRRSTARADSLLATVAVFYLGISSRAMAGFRA